MVWDSDKQSRGPRIQVKGQDGQTSVDGTYSVRISHIEEVAETFVTRGYGRLMPGLDRRIIVRRSVTTRNQFGESSRM